MEKMPYQERFDSAVHTLPIGVADGQSRDWRSGLPTLTGSCVTLRELRVTDAASLFTALTSEEVSRFISPPPSTVQGFERFIEWTHRQRAAGQYICFAVTLRGTNTAVGLFQVRSLEAGFATAEWGFAIASELWGSGAFVDGAGLVLDYSFDVIGVRRLEARAAIKNGRGNGALRKLGAVQEATLRRSFLRNGEYLNQALWTILSDDWRALKRARGYRTIH